MRKLLYPLVFHTLLGCEPLENDKPEDDETGDETSTETGNSDLPNYPIDEDGDGWVTWKTKCD